MLCIGAHPSIPMVQRSNTEAMVCAALNNEAIAATHALASKRSPSRFCFHFSFFTFFLLFFLHFSFPPSESTMRLLPEQKRMRLHIGCGSDGRIDIAFF